jgi:CRISPR/Cas system-associated endonuclease Cas1
MARVHKHILLITDAGVTLGVYGRTLVFRARELELTAVPKTTRLIIMDGFGGSITTAAVNEAASRNIEVLVAARDQGTMTLFAPSPQINASRAALNTREQQFRAVFDKRKTSRRKVTNGQLSGTSWGNTEGADYRRGQACGGQVGSNLVAAVETCNISSVY